MKKITVALIGLCSALCVVPAHSDPTLQSQLNQNEQLSLIASLSKSYVLEHGHKPTTVDDAINQVREEKSGEEYMKVLRQLSSGQHKDAISIDYVMHKLTADWGDFNAPKALGTKYAYISSSQFVVKQLSDSPAGNYSVMWDDYTTSIVPYDMIFVAYKGMPVNGNNLRKISFPDEYAFLPYGISYEEYFSQSGALFAPTYKRTYKEGVQNGGPESLVQLSRRANFPDSYGIDREKLYQVFDYKQTEFSPDELMAGAAKLGFALKRETLTLDQLQKSGKSALLILKDTVKMATLTAIDDDRAVAVIYGLTHNTEREFLEAHYSGQVLVPAALVGRNASLVADDAVREVKLLSLDEEVPQQFVLRNTGNKALTLQLEYPLLGVSEPSLSATTLAPGATATLSFNVKWRSILQTSQQNVLVSLKTSDPLVPRLQLAVLLTPPALAGN